MNKEPIVRIGKTRIGIQVAGCIGCGTLYSHHWESVREVRASIGKRQFVLTISRCGHCSGVPEPAFDYSGEE